MLKPSGHIHLLPHHTSHKDTCGPSFLVLIMSSFFVTLPLSIRQLVLAAPVTNNEIQLLFIFQGVVGQIREGRGTKHTSTSGQHLTIRMLLIAQLICGKRKFKRTFLPYFVREWLPLPASMLNSLKCPRFDQRLVSHIHFHSCICNLHPRLCTL